MAPYAESFQDPRHLTALALPLVVRAASTFAGVRTALCRSTSILTEFRLRRGSRIPHRPSDQPATRPASTSAGVPSRAFEALTSGRYENFCLFSCEANGHPAAAIAAVTVEPPPDGTGEDEYIVTPLFVSVGPGIVLVDHDGREA